MPTLYKTPGVFIEELPAAGPIEAVGTSTAAFVGPALAGPMNKPIKVTNWTQFTTRFGTPTMVDGRVEVSPYSTHPRHLYLPYAVRGFFENGGSTCYIVRVGTGARAFLNLEDRADELATAPPPATAPPSSAPLPPPGIALRIEARKEGKAGNQITVQVDDSSLRSTEIARAKATITSGAQGSTQITVDDVSGFQPGDDVLLTPGPGATPSPTPGPGPGPAAPITVRIQRIREDDNALVLGGALSGDFTNGTAEISNLDLGALRFRVKDTRGIYRGSAIRLLQSGGNTEDAEVANVVRLLPEDDGSRPGFLTLKAGLAYPYDLDLNANPVSVQTLEFTLIFEDSNGGREEFENLSMNPDHPRYYALIANGVPLINSRLVEVLTPDEPNLVPPPRNRPAVLTATNLQGGQEDDLLALEPSHFIAGIDALERVDDVNILCIPDVANDNNNRSAVQSYMVTHCERMFDRVAIIDPQEGLDLSDEGILGQRNRIQGTPRGFAALYYPQIYIQNPAGTGRIKVPPSGHIAGLYARSDAENGVHKAPANEVIRSALALERELTDAEQGELNIQGVNVLRVFPGMGPTVWGARTLSTETAWRYISTRRLFLMIEESIQEGTRWAVFEPNNTALWATIKRNVTAFLTGVWRDGALFGLTPEQAFYVKVDEELNPPEVRALGQLIIEVGVVPVFPAEFIIFRVQQLPGGAEVTEA
jgi:phage tail sheath protein FI